MIMMLSLLAGVAGQPVVVRPAPPMVIQTAPAYSTPLPPLPEGAEPAVRATANVPALFSTDDYPATARRYAQQGTVAFAVAIDSTGRVTACSVTQGSGSISLDWATCSIIQRRARFTPARDADGRAVEDRFAGRVRWVLPPRTPMPFADQKRALVYPIDDAGVIGQCRVEGRADSTSHDRLCASMLAKGRSIVATAGTSTVLANRELVLEEGFLIGGPDRASNVGQKPGEMRTMLVALEIEVDAAGSVTRCVAASQIMPGVRIDKGCEDSLRGKFVALDPGAGERSLRRGVRYWATYTRPID